MIRHFGASAYAEVMNWPRRLIVRAAQLETERRAERRLDALLDAALSDSLELGRRYVDPEAKNSSSKAYYDLSAFNAHMEALSRAARPWEHTAEVVLRRREEAEDAMWRKFQEIGGARA